MSDHSHEVPVPKPALIAIGALLVTVVVLTGLSRLTGIGASPPVALEQGETISVRFADGDDGSVIVSDAASGETIHTYAPETGGFVRVALRALAFDRQTAEIGSEPPFTLVRTPEDRFYIADPSLDRVVALRAFGQGNAESFAPLFENTGERS